MTWQRSAAREDHAIRANAGRAVVQLLFCRPEGLSLERIKSLLRDGLRDCTDPLERAVASISSDQLIAGILEANALLDRVGLHLQLVNGYCRLQTAPVRPEAFAAMILDTSLEHADMISKAGLEVLAAIAFEQPVDNAQIEAWFDGDKHAVLERLLAQGLIEKHRQPNGRVVYSTTAEFLRRYKIKDQRELALLCQSMRASSGPPNPSPDG